MPIESNINAHYIKRAGSAVLTQGDILENVEFGLAYFDAGETVVQRFRFPYTVIVSQDCDLSQDSKNRNDRTAKTHDKYVPSVLVVPAYISTDLRDGKHLESVGQVMERQNTERWGLIIRQNNKRFHYLSESEDFRVPELIIDFKHFFTLNKELVEKNFSKFYLATINEIFREELSQRFANYLSRIGTPDLR